MKSPTNSTSSTKSDPGKYDVIPPSHSARTLVLCFDGTGDCFDADNSNVVQFFSTLKKDDRTQQMVYYQAGIGTYTTPEIATPMMAKLSETLDMMFAWNLDAHVMEGYVFLMQNYTAGDKICIFGFSRGAYTARALAGMIHKVGLLPACNQQQVPFAYKMFSREDDTGWQQSTAFKKAFSMDVDIEFIGVWDTIVSVGIIPRRLPFTASNTAIKTFRHAVSLDEHRVKFKANLWNRTTARESQLGTQRGQMPKAGKSVGGMKGASGAADVNTEGTRDDTPTTGAEKQTNGKTGKSKRNDTHHVVRKNTVSVFEAAFDATEEYAHETDVLEVWFAGCHCDVGGGSVANSSRHNLARIPLRWMIRQCFLANTGIRFHASLLAAIGLDPASLYPIVKTRPPAIFYSPPAAPGPTSERITTSEDTPEPLINFTDPPSGKAAAKAVTLGYGNVLLSSIKSEEEEDLADALCPIYDQLRLAPLWWLLEVLPMKVRTQRDDNNEWDQSWSVNLGRPRVIPEQQRLGFNVHRSVKIRMEAGNAAADAVYIPRAHWKFEPKWVD